MWSAKAHWRACAFVQSCQGHAAHKLNGGQNNLDIYALPLKSCSLNSPKRARNKKTGKEPIAASPWNCIMGLKRLNRLNDSSGSSHLRDLQRLCAHVNWFLHVFASRFTLGCRWNESVHEIMLPLAHAASEGSDGPAHPPSLARGITAHIHNEGACLKLGL